MGYYAIGNGFIGLKEGSDISEVKRILKDAPFESYLDKNERFVEVYGDEKYSECGVLESLSALAPFTADGVFDFTGEDAQIWRFVFKDGAFIEEDGTTIFESEERQNKRIKTALVNLLNDFSKFGREESAVLKNALDVGLTEDDLKYLGFEYLLDLKEDAEE